MTVRREPSSAPIVLVRGAWHGSWCWTAVTPFLAAAGRSSTALDMEGHGLLAGHSMSGHLITAAAQKAPQLVERLVYVCGFMPASGTDAGGYVHLETSHLPFLSQPDRVASAILEA